MYRKPLIVTLAILIAAGTAFFGTRAILAPAAAAAPEAVGAVASPGKAIRFRVSRPVNVRNPELRADRARPVA